MFFFGDQVVGGYVGYFINRIFNSVKFISVTCQHDFDNIFSCWFCNLPELPLFVPYLFQFIFIYPHYRSPLKFV